MQRGRSLTKKSPAQLDREIAQVLSGRRNGRPRSAHAEVKGVQRIGAKQPRGKAKSNGGKKQEQLLEAANAAAIGGDLDGAEKTIGKGKQRAIATSYNTITPESATEGDFDDRGWVDEEGDAIEVDASDIEEQLDVGSKAPVTDAIVKRAVRWLRDNGAHETSSTAFHPGLWYSQPFEVSDYTTGEERSEDFFLRNFTADEEKRVFDEFMFDRRRR